MPPSNHLLQSTTDPAMVAALHVQELAENGKIAKIDDVIQGWSRVPDRHFIAAGSDGFVAYQTSADQGCYISDLYIIPSARRQGIGTALLRAVQDRHTRIELHVDPHNAAARACYQAEGFVEQPACGTDPEGRILMVYDSDRGDGSLPADRTSRESS